jgi:hypothetical protein
MLFGSLDGRQICPQKNRTEYPGPDHIVASFNLEKLVCRIPFHFCAKQQQQQHLTYQGKNVAFSGVQPHCLTSSGQTQ